MNAISEFFPRPPLTQITVLVCFCVFNGCYSSATLRPNEFSGSNHCDIVVVTYDGFTIEYKSEEYSIVQVDSLRFIKGKGVIIPSKDTYEGLLPFARIESVATHEYTTFFYLSAVIVFSFVVYSWYVLTHMRWT